MIEELSIKGLSPIPFTWAAPSMTPTGYSEIGYSSNNAVFRWVTNAAQIVDNFSFVRGAHTVKAGLTIQFKRMTIIQWGQPDGTYTFSGQFSSRAGRDDICHALADLLLGYPSSYTVQTAPFSPHLSYTNMGYYIQDDWKRHAGLRPMCGLRWNILVGQLSVITGSPVLISRPAGVSRKMDTRVAWSILLQELRAQDRTCLCSTDRIVVRAGYGSSTPLM